MKTKNKLKKRKKRRKKTTHVWNWLYQINIYKGKAIIHILIFLLFLFLSYVRLMLRQRKTSKFVVKFLSLEFSERLSNMLKYMFLIHKAWKREARFLTDELFLRGHLPVFKAMITSKRFRDKGQLIKRQAVGKIYPSSSPHSWECLNWNIFFSFFIHRVLFFFLSLSFSLSYNLFLFDLRVFTLCRVMPLVEVAFFLIKTVTIRQV